MTEEVTTVEETAPLGMAYSLLSDRDIRTLGISPPPADEESIERVQALLDEPVSSVMSSNVIRVSPETDLREVVDLMVGEKIGAVPVCDDATGDLLGILSYVDALAGMRELLEPEE